MRYLYLAKYQIKLFARGFSDKIKLKGRKTENLKLVCGQRSHGYIPLKNPAKGAKVQVSCLNREK